ncbi:MAG: ATP-dependent sacrificial sulfur transferase LarE [Acidobacteriota bacterium]|nr:ATP-dependent sacrificial sulfur transferase LarE [Acidobacteriota bacterium]
MDLSAKSAKLQSTLEQLGSVLVAYSGGTDSAYLAYAAHQALGERMLAVIADSASLPRAELQAALAFTAQHNIPTEILHTNELESADYTRNDSQRCFHCKDELFTQMEQTRAARGFEHLAYGMNLDDRGEFRPGQQAAADHQAVAPLVSAQLTKQEIRLLAQQAGLTLWDKPASACLASRIEYGRPVTRENLSQIEQAEAALHTLGFRQVRVRHHGELARIEISRDELPRALNLDALDRITAALRALGFVYITLDTEGYRSGSMNHVLPDLLPASAIKPAVQKQ